jgi:hypothetical protein
MDKKTKEFWENRAKLAADKAMIKINMILIDAFEQWKYENRAHILEYKKR